jgi:superfamily II DNA or RNA helicase
MTKRLMAANGLTELQMNFVQAVGRGLRPADAVAESGYQTGNPHQVAHHLLRTPSVMRAIQVETARQLAEAAPMALDVVKRLALGELGAANLPKVRLDAAKTLLDRAGMIAPKAKDADASLDKQLNEMSVEELRALMGRLEEAITSQAKDVSAPLDAPEEANALTLLD